MNEGGDMEIKNSIWVRKKLEKISEKVLCFSTPRPGGEGLCRSFTIHGSIMSHDTLCFPR